MLQMPFDKEHLGEVEYYPKYGMPFSCFPYCGNTISSGFLVPPVMAKFANIQKNVAVDIWCKVWSKNIWLPSVQSNVRSGFRTAYLRDVYGSIRFQLYIED